MAEETTITVDVSLDASTTCAECGADLDAKLTVGTRWTTLTVEVEVPPCANCMERARRQGREAGA